jgi:uncharacterized protein (DUF362 family)
LENEVGVVRADGNRRNHREHVSSALKLINFKPKSSVNSVAIKPNLCYYWDAATGYTTDPTIVSGIIDYLRENIGQDVKIKIVEADASAMQTKYAFPILGYTKLAEEKRVELLNLSEDTIVEREVKVNGRKFSFKIPLTLLESDLFINVPKMKIMRATHITCALKNVFGCIALPRKVTYHPFLEEAIVGINKILKPDLSLVDGLVALGRFPVRLGLLVTGENPFSVDWVAAQVMGYNPRRIKFLNLAVKEGFGNPNDIVVRGEKIKTFREHFPSENNAVSKVKISLQFSLLRTYSRLVGDIIPPSLDDF